MVTLADRQYTLENFYSFVESCARNNHSLPEQTYKQITNLAEKVGAPTYSRTPNFKRGGRQKQKYKCSPENWEAMRNFKATTINKETEGVNGKVRMEGANGRQTVCPSPPAAARRSRT